MGDQQLFLDTIKKRSKNFFTHQEGSHDWFHIERVLATARELCKLEGADPYVVELAVLLHDVGDYKLNNGDTTIGSSKAREWMEDAKVNSATIDHVCEIIDAMSFRDGTKKELRTIEGKVTQDADRLDAMGAIGIARAFAYGGSKGRLLHDPHKSPGHFESFEERVNANTGTINHFHEKLFLLKEQMNTESAKKRAEGRHLYMEQFLEQFHAEWDGTK